MSTAAATATTPADAGDANAVAGHDVATAASSHADGSADGSLNVVWLLGRGRSGTTWLARTLGLYRHCHFKHEPFLQGKDRRYTEWLDRLGSAPDTPEADAALRGEIHALLRGCQHQVDYPPFIRKACRRQSPALLRLTWQIGKWATPLRGLYEAYGRPSYRDRRDALLVKDVNFPNERLDRACRLIRPWVVALFRNPFASVDAARRWAEGEPFKTPANVARVRDLLLHDLGCEHLRRFEPRLDDMHELEFEALRWRIQSEPLHEFVDRYDRGLVMVFEDNCQDPMAAARRVFDFVGWPMETQVEEFVRSNEKRDGSLTNEHQRGFERDSGQIARKWRKNLADDEIDLVRGIVGDSPILHRWPGIMDN